MWGTSSARKECHAETGAQKPKEVKWHDEAPKGKLDLLVTLDFRMSTTCVYSDIVLPTATWYEKNDLNTSDMHPFIHPLTAATDLVAAVNAGVAVRTVLLGIEGQSCDGPECAP